jgi:serine protease Do
MKKAEGALVDEAQADTPAAKAGIQAGDVITAVNGKAVKDSRELAREISTMTPGSTAKLDVLRKGESKTFDVTLATMPNQKEANAGDHDNSAAGTPHLGLSVAPAAEVAGAGSKGVVVTNVDPDGPAAEHGFQSGDVILTVGLNRDGSVYSIDVTHSSGYDVIDKAAIAIVRLCAPFPPLPSDSKEKVDILYITRTWQFQPGDVLKTR